MAVWGSELVSQFWAQFLALGSEFGEEWERNDLRAALFRLLLAWLLLSVTAIHLAWRGYGPTVTAFYYRQGETPRSHDSVVCMQLAPTNVCVHPNISVYTP